MSSKYRAVKIDSKADLDDRVKSFHDKISIALTDIFDVLSSVDGRAKSTTEALTELVKGARLVRDMKRV